MILSVGVAGHGATLAVPGPSSSDGVGRGASVRRRASRSHGRRDHRRGPAADPGPGAGVPAGRRAPGRPVGPARLLRSRGRVAWPPAVARCRCGALWVLAAATTIVLNLDTTVVLLTPLYLRLARRAGGRPGGGGPGAAAAGQPGVVGAAGVQPDHPHRRRAAPPRASARWSSHLALPSLAASAVGWLVYRRRHPTTAGLPGRAARRIGRSLRVGGGVVGGGAGGVHPGRGRRGAGLGGGPGGRCWC